MNKDTFLSKVYSFIHLISLYLHGEKADIEIDEETLSFYIKLAKMHSLSALLYKAITDTGARVNPSQLKVLEEAYYHNVQKTILFEKEREELYTYLNDNKIDFLPLKGLVIRDYYPDIYTREYADYDILFSDNGRKLIKVFFLSRGYEIKHYHKNSKDDVYHKKPVYNFEMHRMLFEDMNERKVFHVYFKDYLKNSLIKEGCEHYVKDEDFYIYFVSHYYKHFYNSGFGLRTLVDNYLYLKGTKLDFSYIDSELKKMGLEDISKNINTLTNGLFEGNYLSKEEEETLLHIASSGTYGTIDQHVEKAIKRQSKARYVLRRLFPPVSTFFIRYPWSKSIIFLPVAWFVRVITSIFRDGQRTREELRAVKKTKKR